MKIDISEEKEFAEEKGLLFGITSAQNGAGIHSLFSQIAQKLMNPVKKEIKIILNNENKNNMNNNNEKNNLDFEVIDYIDYIIEPEKRTKTFSLKRRVDKIIKEKEYYC